MQTSWWVFGHACTKSFRATQTNKTVKSLKVYLAWQLHVCLKTCGRKLVQFCYGAQDTRVIGDTNVPHKDVWSLVSSDLKSTMYKCFMQAYHCLCCVEDPPPLPTYQVLCIGIINSGKTTLLSVINNENPDRVVSTIGEFCKMCWP